MTIIITRNIIFIPHQHDLWSHFRYIMKADIIAHTGKNYSDHAVENGNYNLISVWCPRDLSLPAIVCALCTPWTITVPYHIEWLIIEALNSNFKKITNHFPIVLEQQTDSIRLLSQINRKMVNTIWFRFDVIRFRKDFGFPIGPPSYRETFASRTADASFFESGSVAWS